MERENEENPYVGPIEQERQLIKNGISKKAKM